MNSPVFPSSASHADEGENVVKRLRNRIGDAKRQGIRVRSELLDDEQPSWCVIGGVQTIFIDLSQTAAEQLDQLEESLAALAADSSSPGTQNSDRRAA